MVYISEYLRKQVEDRAKGVCEYCQTQNRVTIAMHIDHIIPIKKGGLTELANLCLACHLCNNSKKTFTTGFDPETSTEVDLYNPRIQKWIEHFAWSEDKTQLIGLTIVGRATIHRLKINRVRAVEGRKLWVAAGWHPPKLSAE
jgi:hypothetical protein